MKKILIAIVLMIVVGFGGYDLYQTIQENHKPVIEFVEENARVSEGDEVNPFQYIKSANDYKGNDINDEKHITTKLVKSNKEFFKYKYTIKDDNNNEKTETIKIKKEDPVSYYPEGIQEGKDKTASTKENKVFYVSDYDGVTIKAMSEASLYGSESSQSYTINSVKDDDGNIIGYECVFEKNYKNER